MLQIFRTYKARPTDTDRAIVEDILKILSYREREIMKLRYGMGDGDTYSTEECAKCFEVQDREVRAWENNALRKLASDERLAKFLTSGGQGVV